MRLQKVAHLFAQLGEARCQPVKATALERAGVYLTVKRDDLLHPIISGNKWRKLKHLLLFIEAQGYRKIASMGGRHSNLLHSLSYLAHCLGWQAQLFVRGYSQQTLTPTLIDATRWGASLTMVAHGAFRELRNRPPQLDKDTFWIGEGGYNQLALNGTVESLMELSQSYDYLVTAAATGTSLAGYCQGVSQLGLNSQVIGIPVLKNDSEISEHLRALAGDRAAASIIRGYEFGGFAKTNEILSTFIQSFEKSHGIPLEPIYSGKSFYAVMDLVDKRYFPRGSKILLIHCGGLQGKRSQTVQSAS